MKNNAISCIPFVLILSCNYQHDEEVTKNKPDTSFNKIQLSNEGIFSTNCDVSELSTADSIETVLIDSINNLYNQLIVRLDTIKKNKVFTSSYLLPFRNAIEISKKDFKSFFESKQDMVFYSYTDATGKDLEAKCYKLKILSEHLRFLKEIFANAYWNYGFNEINP